MNNILNIKILLGIPGSGKSSWAKKYVAQNRNIMRISRDDMRHMLVEDIFTDGNDNLINNAKLLYKVANDRKKSDEERITALSKLQSMYPADFGNLDLEAIKAGKGELAYKNLTKAIIASAKARAAKNELDKRAEADLQEDL